MKSTAATIPALFQARVAATPHALALQEFDARSGRMVRPLTWRDWADASVDVAGALVSSGLRRGECVAILASNGALWPLADVGIVLAGLVSVGIYPSSSELQVRSILDDSGARVVIVDSDEQLQKVRRALDGAVNPPLVVAAITDGTVVHPALDDFTDPFPVAEVQVRVTSWDAWCEGGRSALLDGSNVATQVTRRGAVASPDEVAMLIYTSGSTGAAKGARIPHRYVVESARSIRDTLGLTAEDSSLSFLPFCHAAERIFGLYTRIACGMAATLVRDPADTWAAARAARPTLFGGLPRLYEKVHEGLLAARHALSPGDGARWDRALALGRERSALRRRGDALPESLETEWQQSAAIVRPTIERWFGDRLRLATSGGATLASEVAEYLDACGVTVLGAYGQTEHLCIAFNRPEHYRHDAVGVSMPGTTIRIADDGEVLVWRSALTFDGYHRRAADSAEAWTDDDNWLRTGDIGTLGSDGFLRITGRKKDLIALSNGKKVAPLPIESRLCESPLIGDAMLYGEGRPYITALLTLRASAAEAWRREHGPLTADSLVRDPALVAAVDEAVTRVNAELSRPEQVRKFIILPHEFSSESEALTPTFKLRRAAVGARYAAMLDALYEDRR